MSDEASYDIEILFRGTNNRQSNFQVKVLASDTYHVKPGKDSFEGLGLISIRDDGSLLLFVGETS